MRATKLRHAPTESPVVQGLRMIAQPTARGTSRHSENRSTGSGVVAGGHQTIDFGGSTHAIHHPATAGRSPCRLRRSRLLSPRVFERGGGASSAGASAASAAASTAARLHRPARRRRRTSASQRRCRRVPDRQGRKDLVRLHARLGEQEHVHRPVRDEMAAVHSSGRNDAKADSGVTGTLTTFARAGRDATGRDQRSAAVLLRKDTKAGETSGQGVGGKWFVASPTGAMPSPAGSAAAPAGGKPTPDATKAGY